MKQADFNKQFKEEILKVFYYTVKFLEKHNLRYVACGGTVLGAVRHKDFIPWDDDMDIYMPREDYERLLDLKKEAKMDGFDILSLRDDYYYLPFAKISNGNTTLWEEEEFPFLMGVYVDIFALDNFSCSDEELTAIQRRSQKKFYNYLKTVSNKKTLDLWKDLLKGDMTAFMYKLQVLLTRPLRKVMLKRFLNYQKWYSSFDGDKTVCVTQWEGRIFKREWFEDVIDMPFGKTTVKIPRDYDGYLTCLYGDYMTPPPPEQQVSVHNHLYLNFNEGVVPPNFPIKRAWLR
ncbi:MAG: LicD family protein [Prevotella sp.]|nr:LicD family protein [Prevotella sp.]